MPQRHPRKVQIGDQKVLTYGMPRALLQDLFHYAMTTRWPVFFLALAGIFLTINLLFALLYAVQPDGIANLAPPDLTGLFFFSVETFATVGYGDMHPQSAYTHFVATCEIFCGMISIALMTGVMFARFSKPRARFLFARHPVVRPYEGWPTLMIRAANARQNVIIDASARLRLMLTEISPEGVEMRRLYDLSLTRDQHPVFILGWMLMHSINEASPLYGKTQEDLERQDAVLILTLDGMDETTSQTLITRHHYRSAEIRWNHGYADMTSVDEQGINHLDYQKFHHVEPLP
ncbi:ion channel [Parachitinimonas caeni]|uniref:Ion channel n=1 Tax=Parachitinimonas caeni TaxID=3031301 RepID=A0ABT7E030_9NEIS|nr:ion channel [Parachitinimonas caeni]MDK2125659.1 ion channel [Parachitinimonas caeni]